MRENSPFSEFFWSVFSPNAKKYGPENSKYEHFSRIDIYRKSIILNVKSIKSSAPLRKIVNTVQILCDKFQKPNTEVT